MIRLSHPGPSVTPGKTALVLNGGGVSAAAYEIGCLAALDRALGAGFCARTFDMYVGVSAGAVLAALGANAVSPSRLRNDILEDRHSAFNFRRSDIYGIEYTRAINKAWATMRRMTSILYSYRREGVDFSLFDLINVAQELLPSGLFSLAPFEKFLAAGFASEDLCNRFEDLSRELYIPAIDLDRGDRVVFGEEHEQGPSISQAITASCALPAFFRPYPIGRRSFIDGAMGGHCHLDVAIAHGAKLLFVINPLVPIDMSPDDAQIPARAADGEVRVADMGISFVSDQAMRILGRDRLKASLNLVQSNHPDVRIVLIEPSRTEPLLFVHSPMSFEGRPQILEYAYDSTLRDLEVCRQKIADLLNPTEHNAQRTWPATHQGVRHGQRTNVESGAADDLALIR